jgi:hypothetical protein
MKWLANNELGITGEEMLVPYFEPTTSGLALRKRKTH